MHQSLRKLLARFKMQTSMIEYGSMPIVPVCNSEQFASHCLELLNSTTAGTAIYILNCLCPEDNTTVLEVLRIDLGQPHVHVLPTSKPVHVPLNSYTKTISSMQAYIKTIPGEVYSGVWLGIVRCWLLNCPRDDEYYLSDETGKELFCQKLRSELVDRILHLD